VVGGLTDEERYTFSSLMTLLIETETKLKQLYETIAEGTGLPKLRSLLFDYCKSSLKRTEMMRTSRVERVVEMALEPITGLKLTELVEKINTTIEDGRVSNIEKARTIEKTISELYARASPTIMQISAETSELLMALSRESMERFRELEQYVGLT